MSNLDEIWDALKGNNEAAFERIKLDYYTWLVLQAKSGKTDLYFEDFDRLVADFSVWRSARNRFRNTRNFWQRIQDRVFGEQIEVTA